jgi:mono/diheme cytochrome c family protein
VLRGVDKTLELAGWVVTALFVVILFAGPLVVADDQPADQGGEAAAPEPSGGGGGAGGGGGGDAGGGDAGGEPVVNGQAVFTDNCGSCHTLSAAGTSGASGPNLDGVGLDAPAIEAIVSGGRGGMPAFGSDLSEEEITAVAEFVAGAQ